MHHRVNLARPHHLRERFGLGDVGLDERQVALGDRGEGVDGLDVATIEVVHRDDAMIVAQQPLHRVRSDVPRPARHQHDHHHPFVTRSSWTRTQVGAGLVR